ncbi:MAG: malto-oligosyltrehalose synthase, partial [Nitrospinae bacterium]|nr:malto-oligosyltrehalose synthase [Nitrospinota bacterium]
RPVDCTARRRALEELQPLLNGVIDAVAEELTRLLDGWEDGRIKMYVTVAGLRFRREYPDLFLDGDYLPVHAEGCQASRLTAFARQQGDKVCLAAVPRLVAGLTGPDSRPPVGKEVWGDTILILPPALAGIKIFRDRFTRREIQPTRRGEFSVLSAKDIFSLLPVSLLESV